MAQAIAMAAGAERLAIELQAKIRQESGEETFLLCSAGYLAALDLETLAPGWYWTTGLDPWYGPFGTPLLAARDATQRELSRWIGGNGPIPPSAA